jgi:hypothetical protein
MRDEQSLATDHFFGEELGACDLRDRLRLGIFFDDALLGASSHY